MENQLSPVEWLMDMLSEKGCLISSMRPKAYDLYDQAIIKEKEATIPNHLTYEHQDQEQTSSDSGPVA